MANKTKVAVIFGGRSVEHEVSIITAMQIFENINRDKYEVIPVYIDKSGRWLVDEKLENLESFKNLKVKNISAPEYIFEASPSAKALSPRSVFKFLRKIKANIHFPVIHGTFGEDGTLQGLFEMTGIPYTGSGVTGSAVGMDKIIQKAVFKNAAIPIVNYLWFLKSEWQDDKVKIIKRVEENIGYPVFVKPANLGSSIAINKANGLEELQSAIEIASSFDRRVIIEEGKEGIIEINCSVLGNNELQASICEQPIKSEQMLTYEDKYLKNGKIKGMASLSRLLPAPISEELTKKIKETAMKAFREVDAAGISRVDFIVKPNTEEFWVTEINTLPGSLSFYLWEKSGINFNELIDRLINLGFERHKERQSLMFSCDSDLIPKISGIKH